MTKSELREVNEKKKLKKLKKGCPICGGKRNDRRMLTIGYASLYGGDLCPSEYHGDLPGYNCF